MLRMEMNTKKRLKRRAGFTLIFAILIASLLAGIGMAITNLALKQISITSVGRESQIAFYAADSGAECALYWDIHGPYLSSPDTFYFQSHNYTQSGNLHCGPNFSPIKPVITKGNFTAYNSKTDYSGNYDLNTFEVDYPPGPSCALVSVMKYYIGITVVESNGINDCSATNNPYRVERSIRVEYR